MRRLRPRTLWIAALLVVAAVGAVTIAVVRALDPAALRAAAEMRLSAMFGQPVVIEDVSVSLTPRVAVIGSNVRIGADRAAAPSLTLRRVRIMPRLQSVVRGPLVVEEVLLEGLVVAALRDRAGGWRVPALVPAASSQGAVGMIVEHVRLIDSALRVFDDDGGTPHQTTSIENVKAELAVDGDGLRADSVSGAVGGAVISGEAVINAKGAVARFQIPTIEDRDLPVLLRLAGTERPASLVLPQGASVSATVRIDWTTSRLSGAGSVRAAQVGIGPLRLGKFDGPLAVAGGMLRFEPTTFALYGGSHRGTITIDLSHTPPGWTLDSRVGQLDMGAFLTALTGGERHLDGQATVTATLRGRVGEALDRTVEGRASITVEHGVLHDFPLLAAINRATRLAEGSARETRFERLSATLALGSGQATTNDLVLAASEVRVEAAGRIGFDRSLHLAGQAIVSPTRSGQAIRNVHELSGLRNANGELELPLIISGTLDNPSFQIDVIAAVGKSLKQELRRRLRGLLRVP